MRPSRLIRYLCAIALCIAAAAVVVEAKEVTFQRNGLTLNANLEFAAGKNFADGVILITHGALAHRGMEGITYLQNLLKERGYNTLAINLSFGLNDRHGMYDCKVTHRHRNDDAVDEIGGAPKRQLEDVKAKLDKAAKDSAEKLKGLGEEVE